MSRRDGLLFAMATTLVVIVGATVRTADHGRFPAVPLFGTSPVWGLNSQVWLALASVLVLGSSCLRRKSKHQGIGSLLCGLAAIILVAHFLADQHWLQPWAWQAFLVFLIDVLIRDDDPRCRWWMRLACSIYLFSAISKIDFAFIDNLGQVIVTKGFAPALGLDPAFWSTDLKRVMAASMPAVEILAGIALWTVRWRRVGLWLATAMHLGLLIALGPLGLNHHAGVLLWNIFFVVHIWVLFYRSELSLAPGAKPIANQEPPGSTEIESLETEPRRVSVSEAGLLVLLLLPVGEPFGLFDHWPGWSVYSNRPPIIRLEIVFPKTIEGVDWVGAPEPLSDLQVVSLSGWSYETWRTPAYPQERFQLAVINALLNKLPEDTRFRVRVKTFSPWRTGESNEVVYESRAALSGRLSEFWLPTSASPWRIPESIAKSLDQQPE